MMRALLSSSESSWFGGVVGCDPSFVFGTCLLRKSTSVCSAAFLYSTVKLKFATISNQRRDSERGKAIVLIAFRAI